MKPRALAGETYAPPTHAQLRGTFPHANVMTGLTTVKLAIAAIASLMCFERVLRADHVLERERSWREARKSIACSQCRGSPERTVIERQSAPGSVSTAMSALPPAPMCTNRPPERNIVKPFGRPRRCWRLGSRRRRRGPPSLAHPRRAVLWVGDCFDIEHRVRAHALGHRPAGSPARRSSSTAFAPRSFATAVAKFPTARSLGRRPFRYSRSHPSGRSRASPFGMRTRRPRRADADVTSGGTLTSKHSGGTYMYSATLPRDRETGRSDCDPTMRAGDRCTAATQRCSNSTSRRRRNSTRCGRPAAPDRPGCPFARR